MSRIRQRVLLAIIALAVLFCSVSIQAQKHTVSLKADDITAYTPSDASLGKFYTLKFQIPEVIKGKELEGAVLVFYVDVDSREIDNYLNETPVLEVYALKSAFSGTVDPNQFEKNTAVIKPLVLGNGKRVLIDVTQMA